MTDTNYGNEFVIGSTEDTHIISEYIEGLSLGHSKEDAIKYLSRKISLPILLTTLTTIIGFSTKAPIICTILPIREK